MRKFIVLSFAFLFTACTVKTTPEIVGEHNLSKGTCESIKACQGEQCQVLKDESVQYICEMVGGEFVPRDHRKQYWF